MSFPVFHLLKVTWWSPSSPPQASVGTSAYWLITLLHFEYWQMCVTCNNTPSHMILARGQLNAKISYYAVELWSPFFEIYFFSISRISQVCPSCSFSFLFSLFWGFSHHIWLRLTVLKPQKHLLDSFSSSLKLQEADRLEQRWSGNTVDH